MKTAQGDLVSAVWGEDGMTVWIRWDAAHVLRCTVATATGDALRVVSEARGVDRWLPIHDCYVYMDDPHARPARVSLEGLRRNPPDCGDNSCFYATQRGGMRTNGGCRCDDCPECGRAIRPTNLQATASSGHRPGCTMQTWLPEHHKPTWKWVDTGTT